MTQDNLKEIYNWLALYKAENGLNDNSEDKIANYRILFSLDYNILIAETGTDTAGLFENPRPFLDMAGQLDLDPFNTLWLVRSYDLQKRSQYRQEEKFYVCEINRSGHTFSWDYREISKKLALVLCSFEMH